MPPVAGKHSARRNHCRRLPGNIPLGGIIAACCRETFRRAESLPPIVGKHSAEILSFRKLMDAKHTGAFQTVEVRSRDNLKCTRMEYEPQIGSRKCDTWKSDCFSDRIFISSSFAFKNLEPGVLPVKT